MSEDSVVALRVNSEYDALLPKLSGEDFEDLKLSIKTEGQHHQIIVNADSEILDGHHRVRACQELGIQPRIETKTFPNKLLEKKFVIESNLRRRHLNDFQRAKLVLPLLEIEKELAKQRQEHSTTEGNISLSPRSTKARKPLTEEQKEKRRLRQKAKTEEKKKAGIVRQKEKRAREIVAKKIQMSDRTLEKAKTVIEKGSARLQEQVESGQTSIDRAYKKLKQDERRKEQLEVIAKLPPPEGKYQVIVVDPPWAYEKRVNDVSHRARSPYPQMIVDEIIAHPPPCADDCVVWLWTTNAFMHEAFHVLEAWGLEAKTILTWKKNKLGLGDWLRGQTEHCILAVKGRPIVTLSNQSTFLEGDVREHSRKPESFYRLVEELCHGSRFEMYGREEREGWIVSGELEFKGEKEEQAGDKIEILTFKESAKNYQRQRW